MHLVKHFKRYWFVFFIAFGVFMVAKPVVCLLMIGLLFLWISLTAIIVLNKIQQHGIRSTGKILSFETDSDGDPIPVVRFTTREGQVITEKPLVRAQTSLNGLNSSPGTPVDVEVPILYHPADPTQFILENKKSVSYVMFAIFALVGATAVVASIGSLLGYIDIGF
jgi:hypothetical protein